MAQPSLLDPFALMRDLVSKIDPASLPIVTVVQGQPVNYIVPAFDPDGDPLHYAITPSGIDLLNGGSGLVTAAPPGGSGNPVMSVNAEPSVLS